MGSKHVFLLHGKPLVEVEQELNVDLMPQALFCPYCGEIWGKWVQPGGAYQDYWMITNRPCEAHGGGNIYDLEQAAVAAKELSGDVLRREFLAQSRFLERLHGKETRNDQDDLPSDD